MNNNFCHYCDCDFTEEHNRNLNPIIILDKTFCGEWCLTEHEKENNNAPIL